MITEVKQGETVNIVGQFYDDNDVPVTNLEGYEFKILFSGKFSKESVLLDKTQVSIDISGRIFFTLTPEQTAKLNGVTIVEVEVTNEGFTSIEQGEIFKVIPTKISDR